MKNTIEKRTSLCLALFALATLALSKAAPAVTPLPAASPLPQDCVGAWVYGSFQCGPQCAEGCTNGYQVTTASGYPGDACVCDITGPQPNCCRLAVLPDGNLEESGNCNAAGCHTSGNCTAVIAVDRSGEIVGVGVECL